MLDKFSYMVYHLNLPSIELVVLSIMFRRDGALKDLLLSCSCLEKGDNDRLVLSTD
jgi:hypothetical protein